MLLQRSERNLVILLALITMSGPMSLTILFPALPALELAFSISREMAQVTTSLATLILAPGVLIYGPLADRFGRRPPLLGALLLLGIGSVICIFSPNIETLIAGRCMQGLGAAGCITLARVMLRDAFGQKRLPRMMAILTMAMMVGPMMAPALSGYLTENFGWRSIFVFLTGFFVVLLALFMRVEETFVQRKSGGRRAFRALLSNPRFLRYAFATGLIVGGYYCFGAGAPHVVETMLGHSPTTYGLWTMALSSFYFLGTMSSIWLGPRLGVNGSMMLGMVITTATAFLLLALLYFWEWSLTAPVYRHGAVGLRFRSIHAERTGRRPNQRRSSCGDRLGNNGLPATRIRRHGHATRGHRADRHTVPDGLLRPAVLGPNAGLRRQPRRQPAACPDALALD